MDQLLIRQKKSCVLKRNLGKEKIKLSCLRVLFGSKENEEINYVYYTTIAFTVRRFDSYFGYSFSCTG